MAGLGETPLAPPSFSALTPEMRQYLDPFIAYAVAHPKLAAADTTLTRVIQEPTGISCVLVYGASGVGKTTLIQRIATRLNAVEIQPNPNWVASPSHPEESLPPIPVLLAKTMPTMGFSFKWSDYYRMLLDLLEEPVSQEYVDVEVKQEQKKRRREPTSFTKSRVLEGALCRRGVRAVVLDDAQYLMKLGTRRMLSDWVDWINAVYKSTGIIHVLLGTYDLLPFRDLSGHAAAHSLEIHFARYQFQYESERRTFQAVLLALLKQVPLQTDLESLMQQWPYFYERTIGCVGILKDWLVRSVAAALQDGSTVLSLRHFKNQALSVGQCERLAIEATEAERLLGDTERRHEHLWQLLQQSMVPVRPSMLSINSTTGLREMKASNVPLGSAMQKPSQRRKLQRTVPEVSHLPLATASNGEVVSLEATLELGWHSRDLVSEYPLKDDNLRGEKRGAGIPPGSTSQGQHAKPRRRRNLRRDPLEE
ncbi:MAG TPA: ATP-binding protein [Ktedonobacteraceae bacterium]|nr:ATP-binding protein [Ktedonobacteraceae bacterium]